MPVPSQNQCMYMVLGAVSNVGLLCSLLLCRQHPPLLFSLDYYVILSLTFTSLMPWCSVITQWVFSSDFSLRDSIRCCLACASSMPWCRNDASLAPWDGTSPTSSMSQIFASACGKCWYDFWALQLIRFFFFFH